MAKPGTPVVVGISGGVDSAVAALLLERQGYAVQGVFMKNWSEDDFGGPCPWAEDQASAQAVAEHLKIPLETWNFESAYRDRVFSSMIAEYQRGRTPNPDILCNREIKFDLFFEAAMQRAPVMATGHYAITRNGRLYKAKDGSKDQSYFLAGVDSAALDKTLFPIGEMLKGDVRKLAKDAGLPNWDRPDSVGICFIGEKKMKEFLSRYLTAAPGPITLADGTVIGQHDGLPYYTVGQRHGFGPGLDQKKIATVIGAGEALFVSAKQPSTNTLVVAARSQPGAMLVNEFFITDLHWIHAPTTWPVRATAKLRYRAMDIGVEVVPDGQRHLVKCDRPQAGVAPGQYAVLYDGDECLGCGKIDAHSPIR